MKSEEYPPLDDIWMDHQAILDRVWVFLNDLTVASDTIYLLYSALELRFFSEALLFRILFEIRSGNPTRQDLKLYRPKDFERLLYEIEPEFLDITVKRLDWNLKSGDMERISVIYGQLGSLLHLPKVPLLNSNQYEWKVNLERKVIEAFEFLRQIVGYKCPGET